LGMGFVAISGPANACIRVSFFFETQRTSQRISYVLPSRNSRGSLFHTPFSPTVRMVRPASVFCSAFPDGDHVWGTRMDWRAACAEARAAGVHNPSAASKTKTGNLIGFLWGTRVWNSGMRFTAGLRGGDLIPPLESNALLRRHSRCP
jgi:hypothetical protein